jgi:hypothetical protein
MPADATNLTCGYYYNNNPSKSTNPTKNPTNGNQLAFVANDTNETGNTNNSNNSQSKISMELYKAKPQYLNTYKTSLNVPSAASGSPSVSNFSNAGDTKLVPSAVWLDSRWSKIKRIGAGLYNLGNNCYLNATLQCMAYTPSLSQWLIGRPHSPVCKIRPVKGFCTLCEVEKIICDIFNSCSEYAKPNSLCFNIKSECQERLELCLVLHVEK